MSIIIQQGRIISPGNNQDCVNDILIEHGTISGITDIISAKAENIIDAKGCIVMAGAVDMHVHLREPGREDKETISSATMAALRGGISSLLAMPNTNPCIDSPQAAGLLQKRINKTTHANVYMAGAITKNRKGYAIVDFAGLKSKGIVAFTDDGSSVEDEKVLLKAFTAAGKLGALIICHCEDTMLAEAGAVNKGIISTRMGLRGISQESEYRRVERDIRLAHSAGARIHIAHISCQESVDIIRNAKKTGVRVTAETCPHYISLCEDDVVDFDTNKKMNPPLRSARDRDALKKAIQDGTIDVLASDHAPHTESEKDIEFERAAFGVIGLETMLSVAVTELVSTGLIDFKRLAELCAEVPARILGIQKGRLIQGADADITILRPDAEWVVEKSDIRSKSKNSPFIGRTLKGRIEHTILGGEIVYSAPNSGE
jgi:dihydroorotase